MDNLTHTLIGLIAGESVGRATRAREPGLAPDVRRGLFVAVAAIRRQSSHLDLLYSYRGVPHDTQAKLSYLLEHRGYTHTVLGCLVLTLLLYAGAEGWLRYRRLAVTRRDRFELLGMSMFGTFLHLGMDFLNSYGIHPFWPLDNRWFYGDSIFIVEPLYWAAAAPLIFTVRSKVVRVVVGLALLGGTGCRFVLGSRACARVPRIRGADGCFIVYWLARLRAYRRYLQCRCHAHRHSRV